MTKFGVDSIAMYTSRYALDLAILAERRGKDPQKFAQSLGQQVMSVPPPGEDIVTMAASAAKQALQDSDVKDIELVLFATESGIDQSKAAGIYVHHLLGLPARCRVIELKQACYSATGGLQLALSFLHQYPDKKALIIASDVARYGLNTGGESSQGCAAVAMVLSANPRVLAFEEEYGVMTEHAMDFWRPNYLDEALVEGKYSSKLYMTMLEKTWHQYQQQSGRSLIDHPYFCYHTPVPRLVETAHQFLLKINKMEYLSEQDRQAQVLASLLYSRQIGNSYTASMYVGLVSLLNNVVENMQGKRIGFYSYGSGCVAEFFSGIVQDQYHAGIHKAYHTDILANRHMLSYEDYEAFYTFDYVKDGSEQCIPTYDTSSFRLSRLESHKRMYEQVNVEAVLGIAAA